MVELGHDPMRVRKELSQAVLKVTEALEQAAVPCTDLRQIATISMEDEDAGKVIADIVERAGDAVTVEEGEVPGITGEMKDGFVLDFGYPSAHFVNRKDKPVAEYKEARALVMGGSVESLKELLPVISSLQDEGINSLVVVCGGVSDEVIQQALLNKAEGRFDLYFVKVLSFRQDLLEDTASFCGSRFVTRYEKPTPPDLGRASFVSYEEKTVVTEGNGSEMGYVSSRIEELELLRKEKKMKRDKEEIDRRISNLSGKVGVITVGASTEIELGYLRLKVEDAVNATRNAKKEGILPGGGIALFAASKVLQARNAGTRILKEALKAPLRQIAENAGMRLNEDKVERGFGFDASDGSYPKDQTAHGIVDPLTVTRAAVRNAASMAGILLTTETVLTDYKK